MSADSDTSQVPPYQPQESGREVEPRPYGLGQRLGLVLGALAFGVMLMAPPPEGLSAAGWQTAAVGVLMAVWWMTEALPIAATSLLPLVLLPVLQTRTIGEAAAPYANPLIFLFMGGFIIALGMERWGLHRRIALNVIRAIGTRPRSIVFGFMLSGAFLSMWVSNTATAVMMLPIGLSVIGLAKGQEASQARAFGTALMLGIAYGCSIGGVGTLVGTPTNAVLAGFMDEAYGFEIGFAQWMLVGVPLVVVGLPVVFVVLTRVAFPIRFNELPGGRALIREELRKMGGLSRPEASVLVVFVAVALAWIFRPLLADVIPGLNDAGIAMAGAVAMFIVPVNLARGRFLLNWEEAEALPWGVLLIFGGGLSLASAISATGLATWLGEALSGAGTLPIAGLVLVVSLSVVFLTELTSNTATAAAFLPIMASVALGIGENPLLLAIPAVVAASCAFMLPVATPPNAIVYGSGAIRIQQMARAGIILNLIFVVFVTILTMTIALWAFDIELGIVPSWAG
ncbi:MAG: DASS family sodium-coupled anion symporter [Bacteroidota bacterium]